GVIYQSMTYDQQQAYVVGSGDETQIKNAAIQVASQNKAGGASIAINSDDIIIGTWHPSQSPDHLTPTLSQPDAVRVTARRDTLANGALSTFFAKVFGTQTLTVRARAAAALTGQSTSDPGELELPVGISRYFFDTKSCGDRIAFSPTNSPESCAGWTSWDYNSNDEILRKILAENAKYLSPETFAYGTDFNFIGGKLSTQSFNALLSLFQRKGYDIKANGDPILDANGVPVQDATGSGLEVTLCQGATENDCSVPCDATHTTRLYYPDGKARNKHEWPTTVVVYENDNGSADCTNPNQDKPIVGFARIMMDNVCGSPDKIIKAIVECNYVPPTDERGGGGPFGLKGPIPGLVE
ncbi:MAG: hypothetical protein FIA94_12595, partial [Nitrospirae bacterium]|nr:hypothetical protein [Nitrospirota bacterium]